MRPPSIIMFERLFLASLALSALSFALSYDSLIEQLAREPGMVELGLGSGFVIGTAVVGYAIYLLLWFLIARKASNLAGPWGLTMLIGLAVYALEIAAAVYLFRPDAAAWLKGKAADPATFD